MKRVFVGLVLGLMTATGAVSPAHAEEAAPIRDLSVEGGVHLAIRNIPIVGVRYRHQLTDLAMIQVGYEFGRDDDYSEALLSDISRIHGALMLTTPVYIGIGLSRLNVKVASSFNSTTSTKDWLDGIVGLRFPLGPVSFGGEYRYAITGGPSTALGSVGVHF